MTPGSERRGGRTGFPSARTRRSFSGSPGSRLASRRTASAAAMASGSWTQGDLRLGFRIGYVAPLGCKELSRRRTRPGGTRLALAPLNRRGAQPEPWEPPGRLGDLNMPGALS